ncbi:MAG: hypothetical protein PHC61_08335 [Chitinivibrionales bacterium]|nr:hypothetical protein [Chitinivibrionales bacterium]
MTERFIIKSALLIYFVTLGTFAKTLEFSPGAKKGLQDFEANIGNVSKKVTANLQIVQRNAHVSFQLVAAHMSSKIDSLDIDTINKRVTYTKRAMANKGVSYGDERSFESEAQFYLDNVPNPLSNSEERKVLYTRFEKSIHEELDMNGNLEDDTHLRIHSAVVKIGRMVHGYPIFNSYATIGIDAVDHHISYLDLKNWVSINVEPPKNYLDKFNKVNIENKISENTKTALAENGDTTSNVEIQEVIFGWQLDVAGNIEPAVIFKGRSFHSDSTEINAFTSMEKL